VATGANTRLLARALTWPLTPALFAATAVVEARQPGGLTVNASSLATGAPYLVATLACWAVGVMLTGRVFSQPAGWTFLALSVAIAWSAFCDEYAELALGSEPELAQGALFATFGDSSWLWWFALIALCLQFTAATRPGTHPWGVLPRLTVGSAGVFQVGSLLRDTPLESQPGVRSPWAVESLSPVIEWIAFVAVMVLGACLLLSVHVLVRAFRRSRGEDRQQLLWLVAGATPMAPCGVAAYVASFAGSDAAAGIFMTLAVIALALGAGLSVLKYRLYDVERVVSESASYALASGAVISAFGLVVLVISRSVPAVSSSSRWLTSVATLAGVAIARPAYLWARNAVDRRFNRRRFDAVQVVRRGLRLPDADVEELLRAALGDPGLRVLFSPEVGAWVTSNGQAATATGPTVDVVRDGQVRARIEFDPQCTEGSIVQVVGHEAAAEIDNLGLRAELARQVEEVTESRARLAGAHQEERQRIERDLHDGAQQRILAIALQLQSARVNGADDRLREEVDRAITHLGLTVQELRDLAGGLQPAALAGGGLRAAVEDLAGRIPLRIEVDVVDRRFPPQVESAAWFVVAEAVANAVKHADVERVAIRVAEDAGHLTVAVTDGGRGGADAHGSGLQGLADRVAALGGTLTVSEEQPHGTRVEGRLPCA
jgi:signal transduction histidine kinase